MLLSYNQLVEDIANAGVITDQNGDPIDLALVNGASIDLTLGNEVLIEERPSANRPFNTAIDLAKKETVRMRRTVIPDNGLRLLPNQFILAHSNEKFFLPDNIAIQYVLKSSMARSGLDALNAGFGDPNWTNAQLTMQFKNVTQHHTLILRTGQKIGQVKFHKVTHVPHEHSYATKGQYNNSSGATASGGIR